MNKILKLFLKQAPPDVIVHAPGITSKQIPTWKKNISAGVIGTILGLYLGQYFPDVYYVQIKDDIPEFDALKDVSKNTQHLKPNPLYPRSLFDYPEDLISSLKKKVPIPEGEFTITNDNNEK